MVDTVKEPKRPTIIFKDVKKDGIPFIEVTVTGRVRAKKGLHEIAWNLANRTETNIEAAVLDFYAMTNAKGDQKSSGGSPFADGRIPPPKTVPAGGMVTTDSHDIDGDEDTVYKYSIVARVAGTNPGPWFLVKDPELEIEL